eukprot:364200-Chlamydomonas_euryale.AAC.7
MHATLEAALPCLGPSTMRASTSHGQAFASHVACSQASKARIVSLSMPGPPNTQGRTEVGLANSSSLGRACRARQTSQQPEHARPPSSMSGPAMHMCSFWIPRRPPKLLTRLGSSLCSCARSQLPSA